MISLLKSSKETMLLMRLRQVPRQQGFAPELHSTERYALLRNAMVRLRNAVLRERDVKGELFMDQR